MDFVAILQLVPQYALAGAALWFMFQLSTNHIEHSTEAIRELTKVIAELKAWLEARG